MNMRFLLSLAVALVAIPLSIGADERKAFVTKLESCEAILRELQADPVTAIPSEVLQKAKAIVIANEVHAGLIVGGKGGYGVALVRQASGRWSVPTFLLAGEASFGLQAGAKSVTTVYIVNDEAGARLLYNPRFNFGVDADAVAGPNSADVQEATQIIKAPVFVYRKNSGLFVGTKLKTGWLAADDNSNRVYYQSLRSMPELLFADWVKAPEEAKELRDYVQQIAGN